MREASDRLGDLPAEGREGPALGRDQRVVPLSVHGFVEARGLRDQHPLAILGEDDPLALQQDVVPRLAVETGDLDFNPAVDRRRSLPGVGDDAVGLEEVREILLQGACFCGLLFG